MNGLLDEKAACLLSDATSGRNGVVTRPSPISAERRQNREQCAESRDPHHLKLSATPDLRIGVRFVVWPGIY